jgi:ATP-binding protein involved in chromosome partitioning
VKPIKLDFISESVLSIKWDNDEQTICFTKTLRQNCPCAVCQDERANKDPLKVIGSDQLHIDLTGWRNVGNYAIALQWSDGHDTGIYTYEFLSQLCEDA